MSIEKLQWRVIHPDKFQQEDDFLHTILLEDGVKEESINEFLSPSKDNIFNPFLMKNMKFAIDLVRKHIKNNSRFFVKVDPDVDGFTSSATLIQFLKNLEGDLNVEYKLNYNKEHGLTYKDIEEYPKDYFGLIIVPDASMSVSDAKQIKKNFSADILVLDHHIIENEYFDKNSKKWINKEEAEKIASVNRDRIIEDCYTNYCLAVNCTDGEYPNPNLSGVGVVQKFIEAYIDTFAEEDDLNPFLKRMFLDLVSLGINADSMDLKSLESRYYVLEGMKKEYCINEFLNELVERNAEDMKWGRTIKSMSWNIAPKINGTIRYGKDEEQLDTFRAMLGIKEDREYQPRRKSKNDPLPPIEIHSLQKTMARVTENVKSRQDTEVRKFVKELDSEIEKKHLCNNSVLFVDGTKVLTKGTVTGLVANKLASKYFRPVVLLRNKADDLTQYGGSCRGYDKGNIPSIKDFLEKAGMEVRGHNNAGGVFLAKKDLPEVIKKCNEMMPIDQLCTIHTVDWEIPAKELKKSYIQEVAENYAVWGSSVPEPLFAISDLKINASKIQGYGEKNGFIRFVYNGIVFVKKYCSISDFPDMTLLDRSVLGVNKKELSLNIIGQFVLNNWEGNINPEVKILFFDSKEIKKDDDIKELIGEEELWDDTNSNDEDDDNWEENIIKKNQTKKITEDDLDFDW